MTLSVPDRPDQNVVTNLIGPCRRTGRDSAQRLLYVTCRQFRQPERAQICSQRLRDRALILPLGPGRQTSQPVSQPIIERVTHRVKRPRADVTIHFPVQRLELVPDLGLGAANHLPPDPAAVRAMPKRDRSDIPVLRCVEVDPVLAMTVAASGLRPCHEPSRNRNLAPCLAPRPVTSANAKPLTCAPGRDRTCDPLLRRSLTIAGQLGVPRSSAVRM